MSSTTATGSPATPQTNVAMIARQAIVNAQHAVVGYELFNRSRSGPTHTAATDAISDRVVAAFARKCNKEGRHAEFWAYLRGTAKATATTTEQGVGHA